MRDPTASPSIPHLHSKKLICQVGPTRHPPPSLLAPAQPWWLCRSAAISAPLPGMTRSGARTAAAGEARRPSSCPLAPRPHLPAPRRRRRARRRGWAAQGATEVGRQHRSAPHRRPVSRARRRPLPPRHGSPLPTSAPSSPPPIRPCRRLQPRWRTSRTPARGIPASEAGTPAARPPAWRATIHGMPGGRQREVRGCLRAELGRERCRARGCFLRSR